MITLKTLSQATAQEVFDQIYIHLIRQGGPAIDELRCVYRSKEGLKCAAGCLIADDEYAEEFEGVSWGGLYSKFPEKMPVRTHSELIDSCQHVHDSSSASKEKWEEAIKQKMKEVASEFNLQIPSV